jgi:hypothetical protein
MIPHSPSHSPYQAFQTASPAYIYIHALSLPPFLPSFSLSVSPFTLSLPPFLPSFYPFSLSCHTHLPFLPSLSLSLYSFSPLILSPSSLFLTISLYLTLLSFHPSTRILKLLNLHLQTFIFLPCSSNTHSIIHPGLSLPV